MIKGKVTQNGLTLDLECSSPVEFASAIKGVFNSSRTEKTISVSKYKAVRASGSGRISRWGWSDNDTINAARIIMENKDNLSNISKKVRKYLSAHGDNRTRSLGSINFKVSEIRRSLFDFGRTKRQKNLSVERALSENGMLPVALEA